MASLQETAYPRLKSHVSKQDLLRVYTPLPVEMSLARTSAKGPVARVGFLILLKTFQRLGYFVPMSEVPSVIVQHIARAASHPTVTPADLSSYDNSGTRRRHLAVIREYRQVKPYGPEARHVLIWAMGEAASER